ncbi:protein odr-4 homolog [Lytechinus pictus]|uniref:protein odr-4 homolog n=1 Tax=Lytechinus pictus TaxID=7653 RepID=UPI0030BA23AD
MGKTIVAESEIEQSVWKLIENKSFVFGLIVGKCSSQKDAALHLIPTPCEEGDNGSSENQQSPENLCEQWVAEHARQVTCMLPGGVGVIGVFYVCTPNQAMPMATKARQALFAIYKLLNKRLLLGLDSRRDSSMEWSVLHICSTTRKTTCKTINVLDHKCTARPADLKYQTNPHKWSILESCLRLDIGVHLPSTVPDCSQYSKQLTARLSPVTRMIEDAIALVDGQLRSGSELLENQQMKKKSGKKGSTGSNEGSTHTVELVTDKNDLSSKSKDVERGTVQANIYITGTMSSRAFVDPKATVDEAIQAVKEDLLRTVHARFDLLASDLRQSSGDEELKETQIAPPTVIATPRRIYARLRTSPILVSDYAFAEEQAGEIAERMAELLDVEVSEEDLDLDTEALPDESLLNPSDNGVDEEEGELNVSTRSSKSLQYMGAAAVGLLGAAVAGAMSYLAITQD